MNDNFIRPIDVQLVIDGDTIRGMISLGFNVLLGTQTCRLARIDAPPVYGNDPAPGIAARNFLIDQIRGKTMFIECKEFEQGKYRRWIVELWRIDSNRAQTNMNDLMVASGHAVYKNF